MIAVDKKARKFMIEQAVKNVQIDKPNWKPSASFLKDMEAFLSGYITSGEVIEGIHNRYHI